jgi:hypothetical protein
VGKFLKPCVGLSVGKQVRSVWSYSEIVNRVIVARKFGRFGVSLMVARSSLRLAYNVLALGEEADFEALSFLQVLNLIRSIKLHLSTEPAFLPNACYGLPFSSFVLVCFVN